MVLCAEQYSLKCYDVGLVSIYSILKILLISNEKKYLPHIATRKQHVCVRRYFYSLTIRYIFFAYILKELIKVATKEPKKRFDYIIKKVYK